MAWLYLFHWNHTCSCYHPVVSQLQSSGNLHNWDTQKTTGTTSTLGCHHNHTGWCFHPVVSQWQSSDNMHNRNTLEDHWNTNGSTLETHWILTSLSPMELQCTLRSKLSLYCHWITTGQGGGSLGLVHRINQSRGPSSNYYGSCWYRLCVCEKGSIYQQLWVYYSIFICL